MAILAKLLPWSERFADVVLLDNLMSRLSDRFDSPTNAARTIVLTFLAAGFLVLVGLIVYVFLAFVITGPG